MLEELDYDILHLHGPHLLSDIYFAIDRFLGISYFKRYCAWLDVKKPVVTTFHSPIVGTKFTSGGEEKTAWMWREKVTWDKYVRTACARSDAIICVERHMVDLLEKVSGGTPVHYVSSAIERDLFRPVDQEEARRQVSDRFPAFSEGKRILLYVGRLTLDRGAGWLDTIAESLPDDVLIVVVGSGKIVPKSKNVRYLGFVEDEVLPLVINASDFVFAPVIFESTSRIGMEAMSCGKPLIMRGRDMDRHPMEDGRNCFVIDTASDLADVLGELESSNTYGRISRNALETSKVFDVKTLAGRVDGIYESVCRK